MALKDLPTDAQPREKLLARGPQALADAELLALLLRTGIQGKSVLRMADELLAPFRTVGAGRASARRFVHRRPGVRRLHSRSAM